MSEGIVQKKIKINRVETIYNYVNQVINVYVNNTYRLQTDVITSSKSYSIPSHYGNVYVRCFGGGGGGALCAGGGGGWMNNGEFNLSNGTTVQITIGTGGGKGQAGGTTSFGTYLSANGGGAGYRTSVYVRPTRKWYWHGGDGGSGGGAGEYDDDQGWGGDGYQFGGGGASGKAGNGGPWGGAGGYATSGIYAGINTIGWTNVAVYENRSYVTGNGKDGTKPNSSCRGPAGKGGFGGAGGNCGGSDAVGSSGSGGGGGYAAKGGDGGDSAGGGGGGFGKGGNGGDGGYVNPGGGGGYGRGAQYCEYNLGHGKNMTWYTAGYGGGGAGSFRTFASSNYSNGGNGICIVQYYKKV